MNICLLFVCVYSVISTLYNSIHFSEKVYWIKSEEIKLFFFYSLTIFITIYLFIGCWVIEQKSARYSSFYFESFKGFKDSFKKKTLNIRFHCIMFHWKRLNLDIFGLKENSLFLMNWTCWSALILRLIVHIYIYIYIYIYR